MTLLSNGRKIIALISIWMGIALILGCGSSDNNEHSKANSDTSKVRLSGTVKVAEASVCDWDVNSLAEPYQSNDTPDQAQPVVSPVVIGGYLNAPGSGTGGRSFSSGDILDVYSVTLKAGQTIDLFIGDSNQGNLDLGLFFSEDLMNPAEKSEGNGPRESIVVPEDNNYLVVAVVNQGASNYILRIGDPAAADAFGQLSKDDFVAGTAIVKFAPVPSRGVSAGIKAFANDTRMIMADDTDSRPVLMKFESADQRRTLQNYLKVPFARSGKDALAEDTLEIIAALNQRDDVVYAEPNYIRRTFAAPADNYFPLQWHYSLINLEAAFDVTPGSPDVIAAVVDSGVLMQHPDLVNKLTNDGYDFVSDPARSLDNDGLDSDPSDPGAFPDDGSIFHGTHVAGTIAAQTNNLIGVAGVGGDTMIMPVRAIGLNGEGSVADMLNGIRYAANMENDSNDRPIRAANIINLSLGGGQFSRAESELFREIIEERNIVVVAAAGNEHTRNPSYPASYPGVISVSAVDYNRELTPYSNFGEYVDVAAPGGDLNQYNSGDDFPDGVLSTSGIKELSTGNIGYNYDYLQGTSMAAPHMSGVVALMLALDQDLRPDHIQGLLMEGRLTDDLGTEGWDEQFGHGLINAEKAVLAARNGERPATTLKVSPETIDLGPVFSQATIVLSRIGDEHLTVSNNINNPFGWLTIEPTDVDADRLGTYTIVVDRKHADLSQPGRYDAQIEFESSHGSIAVSISVEALDPENIFGVIGLHHVMLLDSDTKEAKYQTEVSGRAGEYDFSFADVAPGRYYLVAGSDPNNNGLIGEPGEAFALYPTWESPQVIDVGEDLDGLELPTGFREDFPVFAESMGVKQIMKHHSR